MLVFFILYQQLENHSSSRSSTTGRSRSRRSSILISVLVGAEIAGVLGALGAIPVAGTIQVLVVDYLRERRERAIEKPAIT